MCACNQNIKVKHKAYELWVNYGTQGHFHDREGRHVCRWSAELEGSVGVVVGPGFPLASQSHIQVHGKYEKELHMGMEKCVLSKGPLYNLGCNISSLRPV